MVRGLHSEGYFAEQRMPELPYGSQSSVELIKVTSLQLRKDKNTQLSAWEGNKKGVGTLICG